MSKIKMYDKMKESRNTWMKIALDSIALNNEDFDQIKLMEQEIADLKTMVKNLSDPSCEAITADAVNEVGWFLVGYLQERGKLTGHQFNYLKPMFCEAVNLYSSELLKQNKAPWGNR